MAKIEDDKLAQSLYKNGIGHIIAALKDAELAKQDKFRVITAIQNGYTGILSLLKAKLAAESAEDGHSLIWRKIKPVLRNGMRVWVGFEKGQTVDWDEIRRNFEHLQGPEMDWKKWWSRLDALRKFRNDCEHYQVQLGDASIEGHLSTIFFSVDSLLRNVIGVQPENELGKAWATVAQDAEVCERIRTERDKIFMGLNWISLRLPELIKMHTCPECSFPIIALDHVDKNCEALNSTFKCASCGAGFDYADLIEDVLNSHEFDDYGFRFEEAAYASPHIGSCAHCGHAGFDAEADICYCCGYKHQYVCNRCGERLTIDEIEAFLANESSLPECSYCHHMWEKVMEE